jgi:hypothetical protein
VSPASPTRPLDRAKSVLVRSSQSSAQLWDRAGDTILELHPFGCLNMAGKVLKSDVVEVRNVYFIGEVERRVRGGGRSKK